jgi:hypothetical protein
MSRDCFVARVSRALVVCAVVASACLVQLLAATSASAAPIAVLQRGYDANVSNANLNETVLSPSNVSVNSFGLVFSLAVDDNVFAQPLYVPGVTINQAAHNVVYVATMSDTVYAFDADSGAQLWSRSLLTAPGAVPVPIQNYAYSGNRNIVGNLGILSTPVIDPSTNTLYAVTATQENSTIVYRLHALDITSGALRNNSGTQITASFRGFTFNGRQQWQRLSLVLSGSNVVFGFGALELEYDGGYIGWMMAYDKTSLAQTGVFATVTNGTDAGGGLWQSGRPPAVDSSGKVYVFSGNSYGNNGYDGSHNFSESVLKLDPSNGLALMDWFTPSNWLTLDNDDLDLTSSGPILIPGTTLLAGGGKTGTLYLLNTGNLGHESSNDNGALQEMNISGGGDEIRGGPVWWQRSAGAGGPLMYNWSVGDSVKSWSFNGSTFGTTPVSQGSATGQIFPGGYLTLSANGETAGTGVIWASLSGSGNAEDNPPTPGELHAYDASSLSHELWNSNQNSSRDSVGNLAKFTPPLVVNGRVYMATWSKRVAVYGLLAAPAATPTLSPAPGTYSPGQAVTLSDTTSGAAIHYTLDNSTPTASSTLYTGPITLNSTTVVKAIAVATGLANSAVASGTYTITGGTGGAPTVVDLSSKANVDAITANGTPVPNGVGLDGGGEAYSATLLGSSVAWNGNAYTLLGADKADGVSNATITLPTGSYSAVTLLGTGVNGNQVNQTFVVHYSDGTSSTFTQSLSDWFTPQNYAGESQVLQMPYRVFGNGSLDNRTFYLYGYSFTLDPTKTVTNIVLPANSNVVILAIDVLSAGPPPPPPAATPTFSPAPGTYSVGQTVSLADTTSGAAIHYTLDGSPPTASSTLYTGPITLNATTTINAIAVASGFSNSVVASGTYTISTPTAATPTFSPAAGTYSPGQTVTLADTTSGAAIYYTLDNTAPSASSTLYTGPITLNSTTTVKAIAIASGFANSTVASATYTISSGGVPAAIDLSSVANVYAITRNGTPIPGGVGLDGGGEVYSATLLGSSIVWNGNTYSLLAPDAPDAVSNALITLPAGNYSAISLLATAVNGNQVNQTFIVQYTDGTSSTFTQSLSDWFTPQSYSGESQVLQMAYRVFGNGSLDNRTFYLYGYSFAPDPTKTVKAIVLPANSNVVILAIDVLTGAPPPPPAATPTFSPAPGTYSAGQAVSLADTTSGAAIHYTLDGSPPTASSTLYTGPITLNSTTTINAIAVASGFSNSVVASGTYTISTPAAATPTFSPAPGTYGPGQAVTLSDTTSGAAIRYTLDNTTPSASSTLYTGPITVNSTTTIKAIAVASGFANSAVASGTYTIQTAATPTFSPAPGTYSPGQTVTLADTTSGAAIHYTLDGSPPNASSTLYTGPITLNATTTVNAIAVASGFANSTVASGTYTISSGGGATAVNLASKVNVYAITNNGTPVPDHVGLDGGGEAYSATLLGSSIVWNANTFSLLGPDILDAVSNATITLPSGKYSTIYLLGTGVNGNQTSKNFVVHYSDGTSTTFKQSLSDWNTPQNYTGESQVLKMAYRVLGNGSLDNTTFYLYGYSFTLDSTKTVTNIVLPATSDVAILAIDLH